MITKAVSVCIVAAMVIYRIVYAGNTRKRKKQELYRDDYLYAKDSDLPLSINWNEINDFLLDSEYGANISLIGENFDKSYKQMFKQNLKSKMSTDFWTPFCVILILMKRKIVEEVVSQCYSGVFFSGLEGIGEQETVADCVLPVLITSCVESMSLKEEKLIERVVHNA